MSGPQQKFFVIEDIYSTPTITNYQTLVTNTDTDAGFTDAHFVVNGFASGRSKLGIQYIKHFGQLFQHDETAQAKMYLRIMDIP